MVKPGELDLCDSEIVCDRCYHFFWSSSGKILLFGFFNYFFSFSFLLSKYGAFLCFLRGTVLTRMHRSKTPELSSSIFADLTMLCVCAVFLESFGSAVQK